MLSYSFKSSSFVIEVIKSHDDATVYYVTLYYLQLQKSSMTKKRLSDCLYENN